MHGKSNPYTIKSVLQLASLATTQKLFEEAERYYSDMLDMCKMVYHNQVGG